MATKTFLIKWLDPKSQQWKSEIRAFDDDEHVSASEWADDYAYSRADKGPYKITEINEE